MFRKWLLLLLFPVYLFAQERDVQLPPGLAGKWYDPTFSKSYVEILPEEQVIRLPEGDLLVQSIEQQGKRYLANTENAKEEVVRVLLEENGDLSCRFALYPGQLRVFTKALSKEDDIPPFALDLEYGETYYLDVRAEVELLHPDKAGKVNGFEIVRQVEHTLYEYTLIGQPTDSTYLLKMQVVRETDRQIPLSNTELYLDNRYTKSSADVQAARNLNWVDGKSFQLEINKQGRLLQHQLLLNDGTALTADYWSSPEKIHITLPRNLQAENNKMPSATYLWHSLAPKPNFITGLDRYASGLDKLSYQLELLKTPSFTSFQSKFYYAENNTLYTTGEHTQIALDERTGWLKYGQASFSGNQRKVAIRWLGWTKSHNKSILTGRMATVPSNPNDWAEQLRSRFGYWAQQNVDVQMDAKGNFRLEFTGDRPLYFSGSQHLRQAVDPNNELKYFPFYLRPGDSLHLVLDQKRSTYLADLSGNARWENACLLELHRERQRWHRLAKDTPANYWKDGILADFNAHRQRYKQLLHDFEAVVDPLFIRYAYWDQQYRVANFWWLYYLIYDSLTGYQFPFDLSQALDTVPVVNDEAIGLMSYQYFLTNTYLEYLLTNLKKAYDGRSSLFGDNPEEKYNLAKYMYEGEPRAIALSAIIQEVMHQDMIPAPIAAMLLEDFKQLQADSATVQRLEYAYKHLATLEKGQFMPTFQAIDVHGEIMDSKNWAGRKTLFIPFNNEDHYIQRLDLKYIEKHYPEMRIVMLGLQPEDPGQYGHLDQDYLYLPASRQQSIALLGTLQLPDLDGFPGKAIGRVYLIDERGVIYDYIRMNSMTSGFFDWQEKLDAFSAYRPPPRISSRTIALILAALTLGGLSVWLFTRWRGRREKRRRQMVEMEIRSLRAQLNPHFIFNTMGSIQNLIATQRTAQANDYLADLAGLMRKVLKFTGRGIISLEEELDLLRQYCGLENLRKPFEFHIHNQNEVPTAEVEVPALLLQPYVENAILHGLAPINGKAAIDLFMRVEQDRLYLQLIDNGIGWNAARKQPSNGNRTGLKMTADRLQLLYGETAHLEIRDRSDTDHSARGTIVELQIPLA